MAAISALAKLLKNPKTARFAESLNHADLPADWATDPEVVRLAKATYKEMGTDSPFFRAWEKAVGSADNAGGVADNVYHGSRANFDTFNTAAGRKLDDTRDAVRTPIFFSPDREFAEDYGKQLAPGKGRFHLYEGWSRSKNTFDFENPEDMRKVADAMTPDDVAGYFKDLNTVKAGTTDKIKNDPDLLRKHKDRFLWNVQNGSWKAIEGPEMQRVLQQLGYDSYRTNEGISKNLAIFDPRQFKSVKNQGTFNPDDPNMYKGLLPLIGAGGAAAALTPGQAQASIPAKPHRYPADEPGWVNPEKPLGTPVFDPADVITGGVGIAGTGAKLLASAMTPFVNYGADKITNGILSLFQDTPNRNGGGGI